MESEYERIIPILKDEHIQGPIPTAWRRAFVDIVEGMKEGDFDLVRRVEGVCPISEEDATRIAGNIKRYGAQLTSLPGETWRTSACQWMSGYWDALVDLYTIEEGASDLTLVVRVYEEGQAFAFEILSVHVP